MINRVVLVGRLTFDPELRRTEAGNSVCSFTVAVDSRQKNPDGSRGTTFVPCVTFQQTADNMVKRTKKGSLVGVEGRLTQRSYQRRDGTKATVYEVVCDIVKFLDPKVDDNDDSPVFEDQTVDLDSTDSDIVDATDDELPF